MQQAIIELEKDDQTIEQALFERFEKLLTDGNDAERSLAVQALAPLDHPGANKLLINSLRDPDPDVRCDAGEALALRNTRAAIPILIENLMLDPVGDAKTVNIKTLSALKATESLDLLRQLAVAKCEDTGVEWDFVTDVWDDWLDVQLEAIKALGFISANCKLSEEENQKNISAILTALNDPDGQNLWAVSCTALVQLGNSGISEFSNLINEASELNRKRIAHVLANGELDAVKPLLLTLVKDASASVREQAIQSAAQLGLDEFIETGLIDEAPQVRSTTLNSFQNIKDEAIATALDDEDTSVRIAAAKAIQSNGKWSSKIDLEQIIYKSIRTEEPEVLVELISAYIIIAQDEAAELIEDVVNNPATAPDVRIACIKALGELKCPNARQFLRAAICDPAQNIRLKGLAALGSLIEKETAANIDAVDDKTALGLFSEALSGELISAPVPKKSKEDKDVNFPMINSKGAEAAANGSKRHVRLNREGEIIPPENNILKDKDANKADETYRKVVIEEKPPQSTLEAILTYEPEIPTDSVELEGDDLSFLEMAQIKPGKSRIRQGQTVPAHLDIRRIAATMAGDIKQQALVPAQMIAVNSTDQELKDAALGGLQQCAEHGVDISLANELLLELINYSVLSTRCLAILTLGHINEPETKQALEKSLKDQHPRVRAAAISALCQQTDIIPYLEDLSNDTEDVVRRAITKALQDAPAKIALPILLKYVFMEKAMYRKELAIKIGQYGALSLDKMKEWIDGTQNERFASLEMLPIILKLNRQKQLNMV